MSVSRTPALMLQGTGSDVGKSLMVAGLCRLFADRGLKVRPFKPQNMANNAAVTAEGGEIGRAQALQARACRLDLSVHMNPVLLKPQSDTGAQVVVQGKVWGTQKAADYQAARIDLMPHVLDSFARISHGADLVLIEGAGSPAEVNLRRGDIANMGFAEAADVPVALIGDIDRGGVIASLVGTWALLPEAERARIRGYLINKFRGDVRLFDGGLTAIREQTGLTCFGVVPFLSDARRLPAEDAVAIERSRPAGGGGVRIAVPMLSRIANFDDFDPLIAEPDVALEMVGPGRALPGDCDLVILPGSKSTLADLAFFKAQGWDIDLAAHLRRGGHVLGVCGGFQMLGNRVIDAGGIEGPAGEQPGLGLLEMDTELGGDKTLTQASGRDPISGCTVQGYEMHIGQSTGPALARPFLTVDGHDEGARSADGRVMGTYLHGLFGSDDFRHAFLERLSPRSKSALNYETFVDQLLDKLAAHLADHLEIDAILAAAQR